MGYHVSNYLPCRYFGLAMSGPEDPMWSIDHYIRLALVFANKKDFDEVRKMFHNAELKMIEVEKLEAEVK